MKKISIKLSDYELIFRLKKKGFTQSKIANLFDVSQSTIQKILKEYNPTIDSNYIYEVVTEYRTIILTVTNDLSKALSEDVLKGTINGLQISIWKDGDMVFTTSRYEDEDVNYDTLYNEIMNYLKDEEIKI